MTRYYYNCPIKAAWMAKTFGMGFVSWHSGKEYDMAVIVNNAGSPVESIRDRQRYVVSPGSVSTLEPKVGDLIQRQDFTADMDMWLDHKADYRMGVEYIRGAGNCKCMKEIFSMQEGGDKNYSIIQRNGEPFFWPEVEVK